MAELVPLTELIGALQDAVNTRQSGAIFITSAAKHSAMITLEKGQVTGLKYRSASGYEAAGEIAAIEQLKFQMAEGPTRLPGDGDLDTATVLGILSSAGSRPAEREQGGGGRPSVAPRPVTMNLDAVRDRCIAAIGPIGAALFEEAMDNLGNEVTTDEGYRKLIDQLAAQIDDETESRSFRRDLLTG